MRTLHLLFGLGLLVLLFASSPVSAMRLLTDDEMRNLHGLGCPLELSADQAYVEQLSGNGIMAAAAYGPCMRMIPATNATCPQACKQITQGGSWISCRFTATYKNCANSCKTSPCTLELIDCCEYTSNPTQAECQTDPGYGGHYDKQNGCK